MSKENTPSNPAKKMNAFDRAAASNDPIQQVIVAQLQSRVRAIHQHFDQMEDRSYTRLPEKMFTQYWLPLFAGEVTDPVLANNLRNNWITMARSPSNPVIVVNEKDQELFRVPGFYSSQMIQPIVERRQGLAYDMHQATARESMGPQFAQAMMSSALAARTPSLFRDLSKAKEEAAQWARILRRYGKNPEIPNSGGAASSVAADNQGSASSDDDMPMEF